MGCALVQGAKVTAQAAVTVEPQDCIDLDSTNTQCQPLRMLHGAAWQQRLTSQRLYYQEDAQLYQVCWVINNH